MRCLGMNRPNWTLGKKQAGNCLARAHIRTWRLEIVGSRHIVSGLLLGLFITPIKVTINS